MPEITQEDLELLENYKKLGSLSELSERELDGQLSFASEKSGFKKNVLKRLLATLPDGYNLVASNEGAVIATPEGDVELTKYAEEEWSDFLPSLKADPVSSTDHKRVPFVPTTASQREVVKNSSKKQIDSYINAQYGWALKSESVN